MPGITVRFRKVKASGRADGGTKFRVPGSWRTLMRSIYLCGEREMGRGRGEGGKKCEREGKRERDHIFIMIVMIIIIMLSSL